MAKAIVNALWAAALTAALIWDYTDPTAPGHDTLVYGIPFYAAHPLGAIEIITGGLAFWLGMSALRRSR